MHQLFHLALVCVPHPNSNTRSLRPSPPLSSSSSALATSYSSLSCCGRRRRHAFGRHLSKQAVLIWKPVPCLCASKSCPTWTHIKHAAMETLNWIIIIITITATTLYILSRVIIVCRPLSGLLLLLSNRARHLGNTHFNDDWRFSGD